MFLRPAETCPPQVGGFHPSGGIPYTPVGTCIGGPKSHLTPRPPRTTPTSSSSSSSSSSGSGGGGGGSAAAVRIPYVLGSRYGVLRAP